MSEILLLEELSPVDGRIELQPSPAEVDQAFAELTEQLDDFQIAPETELTMGVPPKPGSPIDPGYFTKQ